MLKSEKLNYYFDGQVDQLKKALSLNFGTNPGQVSKYLDLLPELVLENLSEGKVWYYCEDMKASDRLSDVTLSQVTVWLNEETTFICFTASEGKRRVIPSWAYPKVLNFIVNNYYNISYIKLNTCVEIDGVFPTIDADWDNMVIIDRFGNRIVFENGEPVMFKCKSPTSIDAPSSDVSMEEE